MNRFLTLVSYVFHPVFISLIGTIIFYAVTPKFYPQRLVRAVIISITILSVIIPLVLFHLLKNLGIIRSFFLPNVQERKIPVLANVVLMLLIMVRVVPKTFAQELFFFFSGIVGTMMLCYVMIVFKIKASMHMMGVTGLTIFVVGLSYHYKINLAWLLGALIIASGAVATSRLHFKAHTRHEVILGSMAGAIPQLFAFHYWL